MKLRSTVIIVGGGPTGMLLASELALAKVDVVVLERRETPVAQARALSMHPRSLEILEQRGFADRFLARGVKVPTGHYAALDQRLDFTRLDSSFPFGLLIPQTTTEALLEARALELGAEVRRGWSVASVASDDDGVRLAGRSGDGEFTAECDYLIGADGARSLVRSQCGIGFTGHDSTMSIGFGDVFIDHAPIPTSGRFQMRSETGIVEGFPIAGGRHRVVIVDAKRLAVPTHEPVTLDEMQDGARRIMNAEVVLRDPSWMSRFGNEARLADRYRCGRVFLAGDAAHIHLPAGGQGMNTGLQDAMNLGWKLAGVVHGAAPASLLDSYERERRPAGQRLIDNTAAQGSLIRNLLHEGDALWNAFNDLLKLPAANRQVADMITALDTTYPDPLPGTEAFAPHAWIGRRLRDVPLVMPTGETTTLYRLLHGAHWLALTLEPQASPLQPRGIAPTRVRSWRVGIADGTTPFGDLASILVRPDGHVAAAA